MNSIIDLRLERPSLTTGAAARPVAQLTPHARRFLLRQPGIGQGVLAGLEALGITSLEQLVAIGGEQVCERMGLIRGINAWSNRRRALCAAIESAARMGTDPARSPSHAARPRADRSREAELGQTHAPHA